MESNNNLLESKILEISNGDVVKKNYYILLVSDKN